MPLDGEAQELEHRNFADAVQVQVVGLGLDSLNAVRS